MPSTNADRPTNAEIAEAVERIANSVRNPPTKDGPKLEVADALAGARTSAHLYATVASIARNSMFWPSVSETLDALRETLDAVEEIADDCPCDGGWVYLMGDTYSSVTPCPKCNPRVKTRTKSQPIKETNGN